jgi:ketol-acid reductoisomerase
MSQVRIFEAGDVDPAALDGRRVAIIGYGSQGHAHAQNLHDSDVDVVVGLRDGSPRADAAREAGLEVAGVAEAARSADVIALLIPDTAQPAVWRDEIAPGLDGGNTVLFAHGFNVHFGEIDPPDDVDVILVAPKSPGDMVRREYRAERGVPALVAVHRDATGGALATALAYAHGLGCLRAGVIETTFADETETDLFGEQAVLCGGVSELIRAGFETLTEAGYAPELAYFECLHELKLIVDLIYQGGLSGMRAGVSDTAEYGDYVGGPRVIGPPARQAMKGLLEEIRDGRFARQWMGESANGAETFQRMRGSARSHPIEEVGARLRKRMAWMAEEA